MQEIKCPKCGEVFAVDESGYAQILKQVRDKEFEKELARRGNDLEEKKENELQLMQIKQKEEYDKALSSKDAQILNRQRDGEEAGGFGGCFTKRKGALREDNADPCAAKPPVE